MVITALQQKHQPTTRPPPSFIASIRHNSHCEGVEVDQKLDQNCCSVSYTMDLNGDASTNGQDETNVGNTLDTVYGSTLWPEMDKLNLKMLQKGSCTSYKALPIGLVPVHIDRKRYDELSRLQLGIIDALIYKIAHDDSFLVKLLGPLSQNDEFISRLLAIHKKSLRSKVATTKPFLAVIRSDYFLDQMSGGWKQIEINTMSVAGGYFVDGIDTLFRNVKSEQWESLKANRAQTVIDGIQDVHDIYLKSCQSNLVDDKPACLDENEMVFENTGDPGRGCVSAPLDEDANNNQVGLLGDQSALETAVPAVLVLVKNYCEPFYQDQRGIINGLAARNIAVLVSTLADISVCQYKRSVHNNKLFIRPRVGSNTFQISTVYFRAGYDPKDYVNQECWNFVECAELSAAVLCPNVGLHLAGCKRVQCALSEQLGRQFIDDHFPNNPNRDLLLSTFAKQFELNESNVDQVLNDPFNYVVKPQREGGTNNLFGNDIVSFVSSLENKCELNRYIAMELIHTATWPHFPVRTRDGDIERVSAAVAEIGAISVFVAKPAASPHDNTQLPQVIRHECAAPLTKIKRSGSDEAGVSAGHGFLASVTGC